MMVTVEHIADTLHETWRQLRWLLAAAIFPIVAGAAFLAAQVALPVVTTPWLTIEHVNAVWRPWQKRVEIARVYTKQEPCPGDLAWNILIEEAETGLIQGPFRRFTTTTQVGHRIFGMPLEIPWESAAEPVRLQIDVHCVEVTDEGLTELNEEYPPQHTEAWVPVSTPK